jgi:hypothetical protein
LGKICPLLISVGGEHFGVMAARHTVMSGRKFDLLHGEAAKQFTKELTRKSGRTQ